MPSSIDICNTALSHLGNARRVASIDPPDGSVEADLCASFLPLALNEMLEGADWSFVRKRVTLALLPTNESQVWRFAYAKPSDCLFARRILTNDSTKAEQDSADFDTEQDIIYANQADAVLVYTGPLTSFAKLSPSAGTALSYLLAAYLAGPIVKGDEGAKTAGTLRKVAASILRTAVTQDANRSNVPLAVLPSGLQARIGAIGSTTPSSDNYEYQSGYGIY